ncbi:PhzF family phenazine biosynthesis protein [Mycobacterium interjectum]|uniref:PhzF family phenazine biosynthesis protein n=1 Tax=Mycobacterium interjectum TaxID=33895 RepID=UPI000829DD36|nr:PhzF family phenazine biosynthesis protein [Mycobacterium interjectum]MCV7090817.1 PhzF family phenazine biosynthesis protein [Mycobacterium interjectum]
MRIYTVDCFADRPFAGAPAAVCVLDSGWPETEWLQQLAAEFNLPATAFVRRARPQWELRWFSPRTELALCGSGTLAAAHIVWEAGERGDTLEFTTCGGVLRARQERGRRITLDFPADSLHPAPVSPKLVAALGVTPRKAARGRLDLLAELESPQVVRALVPDLAAVAALEARGLIVTAGGGADGDFVSRFFAPAAGIDEDPVTASAHCTLGAYWSKKLGKTALTGLQVSPRGGRIDLRLREGRVDLTGRAVTISRGELAI